jgi:hypothetical protein
MKTFLLTNCLLINFFLFSSCQKEDSQLSEITFDFELLDDNGNSSTEFNEGENFIFRFLIINYSNEVCYLKPFNSEDFFRVYEKKEDSLIDFGKPFAGMFCLKIGVIQINAGDTLKFETPWTVPENFTPNDGLLFCGGKNAIPLPKGSFVTNIRNSIQLTKGDNLYEKKELNLTINFFIR